MTPTSSGARDLPITKLAGGMAGAILLALMLGLLACSQPSSTPSPPRPQPPDTSPVAARTPAPRRPPTPRPTPAPIPGAATRIRLMAANLSSGNGQNYDLGHGLRILQGARPDVVMIQEFNYRTNNHTDIQSLASSVMGGTAYYYREADAQVPNGVISRYPIRSSGEWDDPRVTNRDFAWACIDLPGPVDLWAVSVHLLTTKPAERNDEARALASFVENDIPVTDYLAIGGDLNTATRNEDCYTILNRVVLAAGPYPVDNYGNSNTNITRNKPYDALLVDVDLNRHLIPVVLGAGTYPTGLVIDPRLFTPIAAIAPATAEDASAPSMQHMGVVKDFLIPSSGP